MRVKYCGPALDFSGYGEANRHDIGALLSVGVDVVGEYVRHCLEVADFGPLGDVVQRCALNKNNDYQIKILHTTPNIYGRFIEPGKYHIGRVFWETDKLPEDFAQGCRMVDEIWTGSEFNKQAIINAGVNKPIYVIPEAIETPAPDVKPFVTEVENTFSFYSVFEWTERKNPKALLESYWREFQNGENVSLVLKTYVDNFTPEKRHELRNKFSRFRDQLGIKNAANVFLYTNLLHRKEIYRLHKSFNCFISAHRGEGWGIPQMEAMLTGNPIISTGLGGIHEYIDDCAMLIPYSMVPVTNVDRNQIWYTSDQKWGEIDTLKLSKAMRFAYENQEQIKSIGSAAKKYVENHFCFNNVGKMMLNRLMLIDNKATNTLQSQ